MKQRPDAVIFDMDGLLFDSERTAWLRHYQMRKPSLALKAGAVEILDPLDQIRLPRAIYTSSSHADVEHNLGLHGLVGRFDAVIASGDYARGKPFPDPFLRAAEVLGFAADHCMALEDSHNGVRAAAASGTQTIMVPDLLPPTEEIRGLCAWVAVDLHEASDYLGRLVA